jgi:hypothetical protein
MMSSRGSAGRAHLARLRRDPYAQAAAAYATYGLVYLGGAMAALTPERRTTFFGFVPWWAFYVGGAGLLVGLSALLWRRLRWLALVLWIGPLVKAVTLVRRELLAGASGGASAFRWAFVAVALIAAITILRAGLTPRTAASARSPEQGAG